MIVHFQQVQLVDAHAPGGGAVEAAEDIQQGALAAAAIADNGHHLAALDNQVQPLQGDDFEVGDLVDLHEVVTGDHRVAGHDQRPPVFLAENRLPIAAAAAAGPLGGQRGAPCSSACAEDRWHLHPVSSPNLMAS